MSDVDKYNKLSVRLDKLDKEYSTTLSEVLTDLHYIKCKFNKDDRLDYEKKEKEIESDNIERLDTIKLKNFIIKFLTIDSILIINLLSILYAIKYLFF